MSWTRFNAFALSLAACTSLLLTYATPAALAGSTGTPTPGDAGQSAWGAASTIGQAKHPHVRDPLMTVDGDAFVSWWKKPINQYRYVWKAPGGDWTKSAKLFETARPRVSDVTYVASAAGEVTAVWSESTDGDALQFYTRTLRSDGSRGAIRAIGGPQPDEYGEFSIAAASNGAIAFASNYSRVHTVLVRTAAGEWLSPPTVPDPTMAVMGVAIDPAGTATLIGANGASTALIAARWSPGGAWTTETFGSRPPSGPAPMVVSAGARGDIAVLWNDQAHNTFVAAYRAADASGAGAWSSTVLQSSAGCDRWVCGRIGVDADGNATAIWSAPTGGRYDPVDVLTARFDANAATWLPAQPLLTDVPDAFDQPTISTRFLSVAPTGDVVLMYPSYERGVSGEHTWRCAPGVHSACADAGLLEGPHPDFAHVAGPDGSAVAVWWKQCVRACDTTNIRVRVIEPGTAR